MRSCAITLALFALAVPAVRAQGGSLTVPDSIAAGSGFSIQTAGSGQGNLYIVGLGQVIKRGVQLGDAAFIPEGALHNAGQYLVILTGNGPSQTRTLTVTPAAQPADLTFLAKPSRLPVGLHDGITGAVYVFDAYKNLITAPVAVRFELSSPAEPAQTRTVNTQDGAAWTEMDSTAHVGSDQFVAHVGSVSSARIVGQVPGDPCGLQMTASPAGQQEVKLATAPVRDCSGNAVPDGTVVTFTEAYGNSQSTVDVPVKRGIAEVEMPAHPGAVISVASGVVMGNQIRWGEAVMARALVVFGLVLGAGLAAGAAAEQADGQAAVRVEPAHLEGPRLLAGQTEQGAIRDYLDAWKSMRAALDRNQPGLLNTDFVGTAKDKLTETIHEQAAAGIHTRYQDRAHDLQIVFYSPEGLSIELIDNVDYDVQVFDREHSLSTQQAHARYVVLLTPAEVRWRVRVLQAQ